jgi:hypothetical protein
MKHSYKCGCVGKSKDAAIIHWPHLYKLMQGVPKTNRDIFKGCSQCLITFVGECCRAVLCEVLPLPAHVYPKLKPHRKDLLLLANPKISIARKRDRLIKQGGGFLSLILPALASALFGALGNIISNKVA